MTPTQIKPKITLRNAQLQRVQNLHAMGIFWIPLLGAIATLVFTFFYGVTWQDIVLFLLTYTLTLIGITVGFHRHFAHNAFKTHKIIRAILAILGSMACQGPIAYWVANHRRHHQYSDRAGDPHSPYCNGETPLTGLSGLWHAHAGWTFGHEMTNTFLFAKDLLTDPLISKIKGLHYLVC